MRKIFLVIIPISLSILTFYLLQTKPEESAAYHVTLAEPKMYSNGIFIDTVNLKSGDYQFSFVPNGDSPKIISINLKNNNFTFNEIYKLNGTLHDTGMSKYYTWNYGGNKDVRIIQGGKFTIIIDPHRETVGSVSVYMKRNS